MVFLNRGPVMLLSRAVESGLAPAIPAALPPTPPGRTVDGFGVRDIAVFRLSSMRLASGFVSAPTLLPDLAVGGLTSAEREGTLFAIELRAPWVASDPARPTWPAIGRSFASEEAELVLRNTVAICRLLLVREAVRLWPVLEGFVTRDVGGAALVIKRPTDEALLGLTSSAEDGLGFVIRVVAGVRGLLIGAAMRVMLLLRLLLRVGGFGVDVGLVLVIGLPIPWALLGCKRGLGLAERVCPPEVEGDGGLTIVLATGEDGLTGEGADRVIDGDLLTVLTDVRPVLLITGLLMVPVIRLELVVGRVATLLVDELLLRTIRLESPPLLGLL